jgi:hypothetical protein
MAVEIRISGPLFDARGQAAVARFREEALDEVAGQAMADVHENLNVSIRQPTPYYETQITMHRVSALHRVVDDLGVIYGPWLEGVGSRNQTTRFKGYASFRRATQSVKARVGEIVQPAVRRLVDGLGG